MLALMTKYWVVTMIGAIGLAALIHPQRAAVPALAGAMGCDRHDDRGDDSASGVAGGGELRAVHLCRRRLCAVEPRAQRPARDRLHHRTIWGCSRFRCAGACVALLLGAVPWRPSDVLARIWSRGPNPAVNLPQALNVWIIQSIVAIGPPLGALAFTVYIKTDWGIPLFFLVPLALVAIPALRFPRMALFSITLRSGWWPRSPR